jgi:methylmalonyl-CoA/ethylmalonyl-CoA epimerase
VRVPVLRRRETRGDWTAQPRRHCGERSGAASAVYRDTLGRHDFRPLPQPDHGVTVVSSNCRTPRSNSSSHWARARPISGFLTRNPDGGMHHICYEVADIYEARDRMLAQGARVLGGGEPRPGRMGSRCSSCTRRNFAALSSSWNRFDAAGRTHRRLTRSNRGSRRGGCPSLPSRSAWSASALGDRSRRRLYLTLWWTLLFLALPFGSRSQASSGEVTEGTDPGAPSAPLLREKAIWTTLMTTPGVPGALRGAPARRSLGRATKEKARPKPCLRGYARLCALGHERPAVSHLA